MASTLDCREQPPVNESTRFLTAYIWTAHCSTSGSRDGASQWQQQQQRWVDDDSALLPDSAHSETGVAAAPLELFPLLHTALTLQQAVSLTETSRQGPAELSQQQQWGGLPAAARGDNSWEATSNAESIGNAGPAVSLLGVVLPAAAAAILQQQRQQQQQQQHQMGGSTARGLYGGGSSFTSEAPGPPALGIATGIIGAGTSTGTGSSRAGSNGLLSDDGEVSSNRSEDNFGGVLGTPNLGVLHLGTQLVTNLRPNLGANLGANLRGNLGGGNVLSGNRWWRVLGGQDADNSRQVPKL